MKIWGICILLRMVLNLRSFMFDSSEKQDEKQNSSSLQYVCVMEVVLEGLDITVLFCRLAQLSKNLYIYVYCLFSKDSFGSWRKLYELIVVFTAITLRKKTL
jgi:hypothetical protein